MLRAVLPAQADPVATGRRSLKTAASANPGPPFCSFIGLGSRRECVMGIPAATRRASGPLRVILAREAVTPTTAGLRSAAEAPLQRRNWRRVPLPDSTRRSEEQSLFDHVVGAGDASAAGTSSPSALAVLKSIAVSYLVGACTGRSAGLAPRRMRSI